MNTGWVNGRNVMVAGATGAIGRATCDVLLRSGARVVAIARDAEKLAILNEELRPEAERLQCLPIGGSDLESWERILKSILRLNPSIDAFIHAAGRVAPGAFLELTQNEIDSIIDVNFRSVVAAASIILPYMVEQRRGNFVVVGSLGGIVPMPYETMYSATKFALRGFCLSLHEEVRQMSVTVSLVSPGPVRSPMLTLEGTDSRAALTFVDKPVDPGIIAGEIVGILNSRRREIVRPSHQRFEAMLVAFFPGLFGTLYPLLAAIGRRRLVKCQRTLSNARNIAMATARVYKLPSREFLGAYVTTMRPYLLFVSGITGIVGMSLVPDVSVRAALLIFVATFLSYGFGQALTDCFQIDTDTISSPYRPLTQGTVTRNQVMAISLIGLGICVAILTAFNPWNLILGAVAGAGLATYTIFKRKWWGGPWYNAWIVCLLGYMAFIAASSTSAVPHPNHSTPALPWAISAIFFGYANFVLAGYFKDIEADARSNYNTFVVAFGRRRAAAVSTMFASLAIVSMAVARWVASANRQILAGIISWFFLTAAIAAASLGQFLLHRVRRDEESHAAIGLVVHAYILGLASIAAAAQPEWGAYLVLFYAAFVIVLKGRPSRSQI